MVISRGILRGEVRRKPIWPPLLAICALGVLAVLAGYYRKVMVPRYEWSLYEAELQVRSARPLGHLGARSELELEEAA